MRPALEEYIGDELHLHFHPGQEKAYFSTARFIAVIAGTQAGKTSFAPYWLAREIELCGEGDYIVATASYDLLKLALEPALKHVFIDVKRWGTWNGYDRIIASSSDKSRIIIRSAQSPGGLESATAKAAVLDECGQDDFRLESWEAIQRRLSINRGRCLLTTTPYNLGWLKSEIYDRWAKHDPDYEVVNFPSTMNPSFPVEEYERAERTMPSWRFSMFYKGCFERPIGLIYSDLTDDLLIPPIELPDAWPRSVGIDFGAINTATLWVAMNPTTKVYYAYRESLEGGLTTKTHVMRALERAGEENVVDWFGGSKSEVQQRLDWAAAGIRCKAPRVADVESGIDRVVELLRTKRLYVFDTLSGLRDELGTYSREVNDAGETTDEIRDKETFHRLDALRYLVAGAEVKKRVATSRQG